MEIDENDFAAFSHLPEFLEFEANLRPVFQEKGLPSPGHAHEFFLDNVSSLSYSYSRWE